MAFLPIEPFLPTGPIAQVSQQLNFRTWPWLVETESLISDEEGSRPLKSDAGQLRIGRWSEMVETRSQNHPWA